MKIKGFTLVELVVVIIVLGILAVVAAPKFLSLDEDAKKARMESNAAAVKSAIEMVRHKAAIGPLRPSSDPGIVSRNFMEIDINGVAITIDPSDFYPFFKLFRYDVNESEQINAILNLDGNFIHSWDSGGFYLSPANNPDKQFEYCHIWYDIKNRLIHTEYKGC